MKFKTIDHKGKSENGGKSMGKLRRVLGGMSAIIVLICSLCACTRNTQMEGSNETTTQSFIPEETVELRVYSQLSSYSGMQEGWFAQLMLDKFNVKFNILPETGNTYSNGILTGNLGDLIVWGSDGEQYTDAYKAGALLDWNKNGLLSEHGDNILKYCKTSLDSKTKASGGTTYGIGNAIALSETDHEESFYTWDIRYDYFSEAGCPEINNMDDLIDALDKMKQLHPVNDNGDETYAMGQWSWKDIDGGNAINAYPTMLVMAYYGLQELNYGYYDYDESEYYDYLQINEDGTYGPYLQMLYYMNQMNQKGLIDPDSENFIYEDAQSRITNEQYMFSIVNYGGSGINDKFYPVVPDEATPLVYGLNQNGNNRIISIGAKTEYPELCMEILNYLCTPNGQMIYSYGPENVCWEYNAENKACFTELGQKIFIEQSIDDFEGLTGELDVYNGMSFMYGQPVFNMLIFDVDSVNPDTGEKFSYKYWDGYLNDTDKNDLFQKWCDNSEVSSIHEYMNEKNLTIIPDDILYNDKSNQSENLISVINADSFKAIMAKDDEAFKSAVDTLIKDAKENGYDKCVKEELSKIK